MFLYDGTEHDDIKEARQLYANQARTFAEAQKLLNDVRVARGYYPAVGMAAIPDSGSGKSKSGKAKERTDTGSSKAKRSHPL